MKADDTSACFFQRPSHPTWECEVAALQSGAKQSPNAECLLVAHDTAGRQPPANIKLIEAWRYMLTGLLAFALVLMYGCLSKQANGQGSGHSQTSDVLVDKAWQELFGESGTAETIPSADVTGMPKRLAFFASDLEQKWYVLFTGAFPPASNSWFYAQMSCVAGHGDGKDYQIAIYIIPHEGASQGMYATFAHQRHLIFRSQADAERAMAEQIWRLYSFGNTSSLRRRRTLWRNSSH